MKPKKPNKPNEVKVYGFHAVQAIFKHRADAIIRAYVTKERMKSLGDILKWCANHKKAYHIVTREELDKIAEGIHHEDVCLLIKDNRRHQFKDWLKKNQSRLPKKIMGLYLDGVGNPHNLGALLRVSAHFGIPYIFGTKKSLPKLSPSAFRIAEGGSEFVELIEVESPPEFFKTLKNLGFEIVATSSHVKKPLYKHKFKDRTLVMLGAEVEGISKVLLEKAPDVTLAIPGTDNVESLNVAVAGGIIFSEFYRQTNQ